MTYEDNSTTPQIGDIVFGRTTGIAFDYTGVVIRINEPSTITVQFTNATWSGGTFHGAAQQSGTGPSTDFALVYRQGS